MRLGNYAQNVNGIAYRAHQQRAEPPEQLWEIPASDEDLILRRCGGESEVLEEDTVSSASDRA